MADDAIRLIEGSLVDRAEIVIGLVGALGTNLAEVERAVRQALVGVGYDSSSVRVSELIHDVASGRTPAPKTEIDRLMDEGDLLRQTVNHGGAAAALAGSRISREREEALLEAGEDVPEREAHATIIRQLKHPEEVRLLRSVYGPRFVLVGAWSPREEREKAVMARLKSLHVGQASEWYAANQMRLLERDEKDAANRLGQRVRDTFELADAFVALLPGRDISTSCDRLIRLLFGSPFDTPTWEEQAMFQAWGARLRSAASGRQVGAVIVDHAGELLVTGTNEVPKARGGQYWTDDVPDHRDFRYGFDVNDRQKLELLTEIMQQLAAEPDWLLVRRRRMEAQELARLAMSGPLADARLGDLLEFGRIAHAEMAAICTAARRGTPIGGEVMMTTTYPCHECARLIIAAGIARVVYIDPYPKSQVPTMYGHEVIEGPSTSEDRVIFEPFQGIAPRLYAAVFAMPDRSRDRDPITGEYAEWEPADASPRLVYETEGLNAVQQLEDSVSLNLRTLLEDAGWLRAARRSARRSSSSRRTRATRR